MVVYPGVYTRVYTGWYTPLPTTRGIHRVVYTSPYYPGIQGGIHLSHHGTREACWVCYTLPPWYQGDMLGVLYLRHRENGGMLGVLYLRLWENEEHAGCTIPPSLGGIMREWGAFYTSVFGRLESNEARSILPSLGEC